MFESSLLIDERLDESALPQYREDDVIFFESGVVGYEECKRFVLVQNAALAPLHVLQCLDRSDVGFLVLDSKLLFGDYNTIIPTDAWRSVGVEGRSPRLSLLVAHLGDTAEESTTNLRAPLLINYETMTGRQVMLAESRLSVTHPLLAEPMALPGRAIAATNAN